MAEPQYSAKDHWRCLLACFLLCLSPFQYGLDFGLIGGFQAMPCFLEVYGFEDPTSPIGWNLTPNVQRLISSLMTIGAFSGSLMAGPMAIKLGRKQCIWAACILCCGSNGIMQGTTNFHGIYAGRFLIGVSNGFFMTFGQLYIQEVIPARFRGAAIACFNVFTSVGSLIGNIVDNETAQWDNKQCYVVPLSVIYAVPAIIAVGLFFIPETPRYLISRGKEEAAVKSLTWLRPKGSDIHVELTEIVETARQEKELKESVGWLDLFRRPIDRKRTLLAVAAVSTQAASGAFFMIAYGTYFFEMAQVGNAFQNSVILTAVGVAAILVCVYIMPRWGRRRRFLTSSLIVCGFCQLIVAACWTRRDPNNIPQTGRIIVAFSVLYIVAYNGGMASFAWLVGGELPRQSLRSYTFGLAAGVGFIGAWLAAFTAPDFINPQALNWGPAYGYIWFPSCLLAAAFVFFFIPETKGRTLEEINEMFEAGVPARKWAKYQTSIHTIAEEKAAIPTANTVEGAAIGKPVADATVEMVEDVRRSRDVRHSHDGRRDPEKGL